ncbi:hypothetical protein B1750_gp340 [Noumeavirus]|uniref:hypothetical protein n=1 Tax=Noumeavirus TaxID=1955558 RepID=UPI000982E61A|nr:hypothetical protein B1750_gp340 [Noumeavirus]AQM73321.1 hypothetical protein NMV_340 [Noumeavirus]
MQEKIEGQITEMLKEEYLLEDGEFVFKTQISRLQEPSNQRIRSLWLNPNLDFLAHWVECMQETGEENVFVHGISIKGAELEKFGKSSFVRQQIAHSAILSKISEERHKLLHEKLGNLEKEVEELKEKVAKLHHKNQKLKYSPGNIGALKAEKHFYSLSDNSVN